MSLNPISTTAEATRNLRDEVAAVGYAVVQDSISTSCCDELAAELTKIFAEQQQAAITKIGGVRNILRRSALVATVATSPDLLELVERAVGRRAFPVRAIFFDKTPEANWRVPWHQDLTIAVAERKTIPGFGPWSLKEGIHHVQPPLEILEGMLTLRLHLDDCHAANGALKVLPGSHRNGIGSIAGEDACIQSEAVTCEVLKGGALLMRPLLWHASSPASVPSHRRVLHIEYATQPLPDGLRWFDQ